MVERSPGTGKRWAEPQTCRSAEELQRRIHELDPLQRTEYPLPSGLTRWENFPTLQTPHPDAPGDWDFSRVLNHWAGYRIERPVNACGQMSIYGRNHYVGTKYKKEKVWVLFGLEQAEWVFTDLGGNELTRHASGITSGSVKTLNITHRRKIKPK